MAAPLVPPQSPAGVTDALKRNVEALTKRHAAEKLTAPFGEKMAGAITRFTGSMAFVYLHLVIYGAWVVVNLGLVPGVAVFDPSFVILASEASVEAIFLSTFVLISQNRMAAAADRRADLDLHISLLAEHELTKLAGLVTAMAEKMGVEPQSSEEIDEIKRDVAPEAVLDELERSRRKADRGA